MSAGRRVSFVRTSRRGSGFEMKTVEGILVQEGPQVCLVRLGNGRQVEVRTDALSPAGTCRGVGRFLDDAVRNAPEDLVPGISEVRNQVGEEDEACTSR